MLVFMSIAPSLLGVYSANSKGKGRFPALHQVRPARPRGVHVLRPAYRDGQQAPEIQNRAATHFRSSSVTATTCRPRLATFLGGVTDRRLRDDRQATASCSTF
ncbi:MAG TPA: hypothetical protein VD995_22630 [Azospirillum sp.]|nr:hypothetical protein [Azospirillum sp.]